MDGSREWNGVLDTPTICNRSTRISVFGTEHAQLTYTVYKVQVGNDQEKAQTEKRFPLQKPGREKTN